jgi:hypothetical protein
MSYDFQFLAWRDRTRKPMPGVLSTPDPADWETRWQAAYSNSPPRILVQDGVLLVPREQIKPIIVFYPRFTQQVS